MHDESTVMDQPPGAITAPVCRPGRGTSPDVDLVCEELRDLAHAAAVREPVLRAMLDALVLAQPTFAAMLSSVLADRLGSVYLTRPTLRAMMLEILQSAPEIAADAVTDLMAVIQRDPAAGNVLHVLLHLKGYQALQAHRVTHHLWWQQRRDLAFRLASQVCMVHAVDIHPAAVIRRGVMLDHGTGIVIGETARVDDDVSILQGVTLGGNGKEHGDRHPKICSGVLIGAGAKILGNIEVGAMSKVAAGSIVLKAVPPHVTVAGVPARIVKRHRDVQAPALVMDQRL